MPDGAVAEPAPVRARADAGIVAVAPVSEVVAALLTGPGMVADFVERQARGGGDFAGEFVEVGGNVGVDGLEFAGGMEGGEARARLDRQLVERQVTGAERERAGKHRLPLDGGLTGQGIDEVEGDAVEVPLRDVECGKALVAPNERGRGRRGPGRRATAARG